MFVLYSKYSELPKLNITSLGTKHNSISHQTYTTLVLWSNKGDMKYKYQKCYVTCGTLLFDAAFSELFYFFPWIVSELLVRSIS